MTVLVSSKVRGMAESLVMTKDVTILGLVGPLFLLLLHPLSLLTHLSPSPSDFHHLLPIYSNDPLMRTIPTNLYHI